VATKRCQGKRRKWRGATLGTFACGRNATHVFETRVGVTRTHYACDDAECVASITHGYGAYNVRAL
jgi:hypothetical protein